MGTCVLHRLLLREALGDITAACRDRPSRELYSLVKLRSHSSERGFSSDQAMDLISVKVSRCLSLIFLAIAVLLLCLLVPSWYSMVKRVDQIVDQSSKSFVSQVQHEIEKTTKFVNQISSSSTINTARLIDSSLNQSQNLSFSDIEQKVAPIMFQTLSSTPHLNQISYHGIDGQFFSYYIDRNQTFALYSNSSTEPHDNSSTGHIYWFTKMADRVTGKLYGDVVRASLTTAIANASWFQDAFQGDNLVSFVGTKPISDEEILLFNAAKVNGKLGFVSLGFPFREITENYYSDVNLQGGSLCFAINGDDDFKIAKSLGLFVDMVKTYGQRNFSCYPNAGLSSVDQDHQEKNNISYTSEIYILGIQSNYDLAIPKSGSKESVRQRSKEALIILIVFMVIMVVFAVVFVSIIFGATMRVVCLHAKNLKQMEATEQAERKSMNKTNAFNTASHDIRASLAGMAGLIRICYDEVDSGSDLETNLRQLDDCAKDLLEILNSILDTSKIEAGKMLLEEEEFDVAQLLEDVVDLFHPMGAKKGVDVILDPCNNSVSKFSRVKCDRGKLRQVLCNLLSNAVKFTHEGQVVVRAWIRERRKTETSRVVSSQGTRKGLLECLSFWSERSSRDDVEAVDSVKSDTCTMELVCEIDDTGKGIPKEKRQEVFENFVQVKDTALGQGGTGLGLGIVQSLVRLMHGEIGIVEKRTGAKGSCFKFNVGLSTCERAPESTKEYENNEANDLGTPGASALTPSPSNAEAGSYVVLVIQNDERRKISQQFMESLGVKVLLAKWPDQFRSALRSLHRKWQSSSGNRSDFGVEIMEYSSKSSASHNSCNFDVPFGRTAMDGADYVRSLIRSKTTYLRGVTSPPKFVLFVIDINSATLHEIREAVDGFRNSLQNACCRVVWLANPAASNGFSRGSFDPDDIVKCKPFHGTRLYEVVRLLPEFGGPLVLKRAPEAFEASPRYQSEIEEVGGASVEVKPLTGKKAVVVDEVKPLTEKKDVVVDAVKPLTGKKILVVDDTRLMRKLARSSVEKLGGTVEECEDGGEALKLVSNGLLQFGSDPLKLPYDYILMDCQMPMMNGYEASEEIRKEEKKYGVHTPIIALTAHEKGSEEVNRTFKSGMDFCLNKPLNQKDLLQAINQIHTKNI